MTQSFQPPHESAASDVPQTPPSGARVPVHFVRADNGDGESLDLIVCALTATQAVTLWREYYELEDDTHPAWTGVLPGVDGDVIGALSWQAIRGD